MKNIIVGIDFSSESEIALRQALEVARHTGAQLTLVHAGAIPEEPLGIPDAMAATAAAFRSELAERLHKDREYLETIRERHAGQGAELSTMVIEGFADTALCQAAEELDADLVILGTHGQTGLKRFLLGSVAERVVRLAKTRVLVAREGHDVYEKIMVPVDFSEGTARVIESALAVAGPKASIELLYCWHLPLLASSYYAPVSTQEEVVGPLRDEVLQSAEKKANELIAAALEASERKVEISFHHIQAPPAFGIQERAEEGNYDLIVMGSHGRRGVRRLILGSVAEVTVRHAPCSVMVVHSL